MGSKTEEEPVNEHSQIALRSYYLKMQLTWQLRRQLGYYEVVVEEEEDDDDDELLHLFLTVAAWST